MMAAASRNASPERLLVLLANPTDTKRAELLFARAAVRAHGCRDLRHLCEALGDQTGAVLVAEEFVLGDGNGQLAAALATQPAWSALPLVILTRGDASDRLAVLQARASSVNLTLIERPVRTATLVSIVQAALRARHQQYALRDSLATQAGADAARGASEYQLAFALQAADLGQWDLDLANRTAHRTARHDEIFGYATPLPEWNYERFLEHVLPEDRAAVDAGFQAAVTGGPPWNVECRIRRADGAIRWIWAKAGIVRDAAGQVDRMLGVVGDLTARKHAEATIRAGDEALREAARRKDEFLATLAHELRNPLAPIRTGLKVLARMPAAHTAAAEQVREMMDRQLRHMVRLVDDLLDISRITSGKIELRRERLQLRDAVLAAVETSRPMIEASGHQLVLSDPDQGIWLDADLTRLAQVLANVLGNAAKFTPPGGRIELAVQREGREAIVTVGDTGIGIDPDQIEQVFEMFSQAHPSIDHAQGGLGIGLALVRRLIELHGGRVTAASAGANRGTTVTIRLPIASAPASPAESADMAPRATPIDGSPRT